MNIDELKNELANKHVPAHLYNICKNGIMDMKLCLVNESDKWLVFYSERGNRFDCKEHDKEQLACQDLYDRLKLDMS